jgi:hypothetical protein
MYVTMKLIRRKKRAALYSSFGLKSFFAASIALFEVDSAVGVQRLVG